ncbi:Cellulose synthase - like 10 [Theobroma cacao]|nr:Cellulose synthase - like 10 [Theobroma cacao]
MLACKMKPLPFNLCNPKKRPAIINRSYALLHFIAATSLIFYRVSSLLHSRPSLPHLLVFASELILSLLWLLNQAYLWTPVSRKTFPERLLQEKGEELPGIDVFICTADPKKEPPLEVMNTVLSAMALDYPIGKLSVYVSDDGGSSSTLHSIREAWKFGRSWLPFCTRFGIKTRCPKAYFSRYEDDLGEKGYHEEKEKIKQQYKWLEEHVKKAGSSGGMLGETCSLNSINHPAHIEVIQDESHDTNQAKMPLLVYVSREKSPSSPHHFKAGALNVLLRVSSMISNSPYILVLDCDMRCNDPTSALQAMCFHLDPRISSNLAFVQFPQKFHNLSTMDIYDGQLRSVFLAAADMSKVLQVDLEAEQEKLEPNKGSDFGLFTREFLLRHGLHLLGTTSTWFLLDIAFYSQNLFQKDIFSAIGWIPKAKTMNALEEVYKIARAQTLIALCSTVPGYWFTVALIDKMGRFKIQLMGFFFMTVFMFALAIPYHHWTLPDNRIGFVIMYSLTFFFANFGPNATTFVVPAEIFPARLRSTCHGISAASGKAGAMVGAFGFLYAADSIGVKKSLIILGFINLLGMLFTFLVPESKGKSLEEISGEAEQENGTETQPGQQDSNGVQSVPV